MSTVYVSDPPPESAEVPPQRSPFWTVLAAGLALVAGILVGAAANGDTPGACRTALNDAERVISLAHRALDTTSDAMTAAGNLDAATIQAATVKLDGMVPSIETAVSSYKASSARCRGAQ